MIAGVKPAHCSFAQTLLSHTRPQGLRVCGGPRTGAETASVDA